MNIHANFTGGNIRVLSIDGDVVNVQNELRDTTQDWFYWAFCVEGAQGRTLTFHFDKKWLGYYGPAISHDLYSWEWQNEEAAPGASDAFTYTFGEDETCVYFAHDMLYHPAHFDRFCKELGLEQLTLCQSERGRAVPYVRFGSGSERVLLTARHHACEATGSYVLEGVVRELFRQPLPNIEFIVVPFVDYDGVVDGDQGKFRAPYDHNRDYFMDREAMYASIREIQKLVLEKPLRYACDFHSPWHLGGMNDGVFIPQRYSGLKQMCRFTSILEQVNTAESLPFAVYNTIAPGVDWNAHPIGPGRTFSPFMKEKAHAEMTLALETPYFTASGTTFTAARARELGRCYALALRAYHSRPVKISFTGSLRCDDGDLLASLRSNFCRMPDADYLVGSIESPVNGILDSLQKAGFDLLCLNPRDCIEMDHSEPCSVSRENAAFFVREIGGFKTGFVTENRPEHWEQAIQCARAQSDFVVMLMHSGDQASPVPADCAKALISKRWDCGADLIVGAHSPIMQPSIYENGSFAACWLGKLLASTKPDAPSDSDFSVILNLMLEKKEDGTVEKHLSFRLCQTMHDPDQKKAPWVVDTYDQWRKHPTPAYQNTILYYANDFMPGRNYTEPMAEYPIC